MENLKTMILDQETLNSFLNGGCSKITELLDHQPEKSIVEAVPIVTNKLKWGWVNKDGILDVDNFYTSAYGGINTAIWIRETFAESKKGGVIYRIDTTNSKAYKWEKPQKMTKEKSRLTLIVKDIKIFKTIHSEIETIGERWFSETTFTVKDRRSY